MRLSALLLALLLLPMVAANHGDDMPSPGDAVLYAQLEDASSTWFLSAQKEHPGQYVGGFGTGATCVAAPACAVTTSTATWSVPMTLTGDVELTPGQPLAMNAWLGSTSRYGRVEVTAQVLLDGVRIASGSAQTILFQATYEKVSWSIEPNVKSLPKGSKLQWDIQANGVYQGIFLRLADSPGWSHIVLPVASVSGAVPLVTYEDIASAQVAKQFSFQSPNGGRHILNWTAPDNVTYDVQIAASQGTAQVTVTADGAVQLDTTTSANGTLRAPGPWRVEVAFTDFVGNVTLSFAPMAPAEPPGGEPEPAIEGPEDGNVTAPPGSDNATVEDQESPFPGVVLVLVALALLASRRRL